MPFSSAHRKAFLIDFATFPVPGSEQTQAYEQLYGEAEGQKDRKAVAAAASYEASRCYEQPIDRNGLSYPVTAPCLIIVKM